MSARKINILGSELDAVSIDDVVSRIMAMVDKGSERCHHVVVTGFHGVWEAHQSAAFRAMLNDADLWVPDGIGVALIMSARGQAIARIGGPEVMVRVLAEKTARPLRSFLFGGTQDALERLREHIRTTYPHHEVVGTLSPPFRAPTPEETAAHIAEINAARPDLLWVGLGCPKQERWIAEHKARLKVPVAIGIGAVFSFLSGTVKQAPPLISKLGFEWAYRLAMEPRLWRRTLLGGPRFLLAVAKESLGPGRRPPDGGNR